MHWKSYVGEKPRFCSSLKLESQNNFLVFFFLSLFKWSYPIQQSIFFLLFLLEIVFFFENELTAFTFQALILCKC